MTNSVFWLKIPCGISLTLRVCFGTSHSLFAAHAFWSKFPMLWFLFLFYFLFYFLKDRGLPLACLCYYLEMVCFGDCCRGTNHRFCFEKGGFLSACWGEKKEMFLVPEVLR